MLNSNEIRNHHRESGRVHGATVTANPNRLMVRDESARCKVADGVATDDVCTYGQLTDHANLTDAHGAVSTATADRIIIRDGLGRAQVTDGVANADIMTYGQGLAHANLTNAHSAVSTATANRIILRDASGRAQVTDGVANADIMTYGQGLAHANLTNAHSAVSTATANRIMLRDANARCQVANGVASDDICAYGQLTAHTGASGAGVHGATATPTANAIPVADANGKLDAWVTSQSPNLLHMRDRKTNGTAGGSATSGSWEKRMLNEETYNTINGASLNTLTGRFTLPAGTYKIFASAPAYHVDQHKIRLYNYTDSTYVLYGSTEFSGSGGIYAQTSSILLGTFTLTASKTLEIQHRVTTSQVTNGYGQPASFGVPEIYTLVEIEKI